MLTVKALAFRVWLAMCAWVPPHDQTAAWREPEDVALGRYWDFAEAVARAALDPDEIPVPGLAEDDDEARARSALLLAAIASYESAYAAPVVDCRILGPGGAAGPFQTHRARGRACQSVEEAAHVALSMVRESFVVCSALPLRDRLGLYTDGVCRLSWPRSRWRVGRAERWWMARSQTETDIVDWEDLD